MNGTVILVRLTHKHDDDDDDDEDDDDDVMMMMMIRTLNGLLISLLYHCYEIIDLTNQISVNPG